MFDLHVLDQWSPTALLSFLQRSKVLSLEYQMWVPCSPLDTTPSSTVHLSKVALAFYITIAKIPSLQLCPEKTCRGNSAEGVLKPREMKVTSHFRDQPYFIGSRTVFFTLEPVFLYLTDTLKLWSM